VNWRASVTPCDCHRKEPEPLAISIVVKLEHDRPEVTSNFCLARDSERIRQWLEARPELYELVAFAQHLERAA